MARGGVWINKRRWDVMYRVPIATCAICGDRMPIELTCPCCDAEMCVACAKGHWCHKPQPEEDEPDDTHLP